MLVMGGQTDDDDSYNEILKLRRSLQLILDQTKKNQAIFNLNVRNTRSDIQQEFCKEINELDQRKQELLNEVLFIIHFEHLTFYTNFLGR